METLVRLFPEPHGFVADFANDLFEILGRYFPVYFTHVSLNICLSFKKLAQFGSVQSAF